MTWLLSYLLPFGLLLGILVFVHESGHFLTAKYFKIIVEKFSIGFGPRIFGKKIGDTEYRVAWIPLGGYVKMAGDDPTDDESRKVPGSFLGAPIWKRMLVVLAGPAVNLVLPIFILAGVYMVGKDFMAAVVGNVSSNTPAAQAGLKPGDEVIAVDGAPVRKWDEMTERIRSHGAGQSVQLSIVRQGKTQQISLTPEMKENTDEFGIKKVMPIIGISPYGVAATMDVVPESPAGKAGLKTGDRVTAVGATKVATVLDLDAALRAAPAGPVTLTVDRRAAPSADPDAEMPAPTSEKVTFELPAADAATPRLAQAGLRDAQLVIARIAPDSPADHAGMQAGDRLVSGGTATFASAVDYQTWLYHDHPGPDTKVVVERDGKPMTLSLTPVMRARKIPGTPRADEFLWDGLALWPTTAAPTIYTEKYSNPLRALVAGVRGTGEVISINFRAFGKIFSREISVRDSVGGPIRIAQVAGMAAKAGPGAFIDVLVHMSVILGIMNLLPIPVLDGGHLAFFAFEAVLRRPPSLRFREVAQNVGMLLLLAVMAFVMVNDVVTSLF